MNFHIPPPPRTPDCCNLRHPHALAFAVLLAFTPLRAELTLSADRAAELAVERNPELLAARERVNEAAARQLNSGRLPNPDIEVEAIRGLDSQGSMEIGLTQRFPITARLRHERALSTIEWERARIEVSAQERQTAAAARKALYELVAAREAVALAGRQAETASRFADSLDRGATEGLASSLEAGQARIIAGELELKQDALRADEALATGTLVTLLGLPAETPIAAIESLDLPESLPEAQPVGPRPDIRVAELAREASSAELRLAEASRWEDVGVGLFVSGERSIDEPEGLDSERLVGVRFSLPLPLWQDGRGRVIEKRAALQRQELLLEAQRLAARNEVSSAHAAMAARYRAALGASTRIVAAANKQAKETEATYRRGEIDIQSLFRARERLAEIEASALEARKAFHLARAQWKAATASAPSQP